MCTNYSLPIYNPTFMYTQSLPLSLTHTDSESVSRLVSTFVIVADNIDKTINPRYMTIDHQRQSLHYMHMYAALDRVSCASLQSNMHQGDVMHLTTSAFLPTAEESQQLLCNSARTSGCRKAAVFCCFQGLCCVTPLLQ